ncbi:MAG TPA: DUF3109 family protein [Flavobacteriales bacterium]|nr:DUF3109 family protein [Flavobacteriales bacterium]
MIEINGNLISDNILEKRFVCDLNACKGACCIEGDAGAPLDKDETKILEKIYPKVKKYLRKEGVKAIEEQGTWIKAKDGELETPLVNGAECAYVIFDAKGITKCGIEKAYEAGEVDYKKPISCHLYPIRTKETKSGTILNYDEWDICKPACACGKKLDVKVYKFLKEPIERKFGKRFFKALEKADSESQA